MHNHLRYQEVRTGLRVRRIEADPEKESDVGRIGTILEPTQYNNMAHTISVKYDPIDGLPEKIDDCCTVFEFEKLT